MKTNRVQDDSTIQKLATTLREGLAPVSITYVSAELHLSQMQLRLDSKSNSSRLEFSERCNLAQLSKTTASDH